jgi:hypothetical protein
MGHRKRVFFETRRCLMICTPKSGHIVSLFYNPYSLGLDLIINVTENKIKFNLIFKIKTILWGVFGSKKWKKGILYYIIYPIDKINIICYNEGINR